MKPSDNDYINQCILHAFENAQESIKETTLLAPLPEHNLRLWTIMSVLGVCMLVVGGLGLFYGEIFLNTPGDDQEVVVFDRETSPLFTPVNAMGGCDRGYTLYSNTHCIRL